MSHYVVCIPRMSHTLDHDWLQEPVSHNTYNSHNSHTFKELCDVMKLEYIYFYEIAIYNCNIHLLERDNGNIKNVHHF